MGQADNRLQDRCDIVSQGIRPLKVNDDGIVFLFSGFQKVDFILCTFGHIGQLVLFDF